MATLQFGDVSSIYEKGKRRFPPEVFAFCAGLMGARDGKGSILDLGCGTGISTRQLAAAFPKAKVIGVDIDPKAVSIAERYKSHAKFACAPAHALPMKGGSFDLVTAFSSFHWFFDRDSLSEVKRVLKPASWFCVVDHSEVGIIKDDLRNIVEQALRAKLPRSLEDYVPYEILRKSHFQGIATKSWRTTQVYDVEGALDYFRSTGLYRAVPEESGKDVLNRVRSYFMYSQNPEGLIVRELEVTAIAGRY